MRFKIPLKPTIEGLISILDKKKFSSLNKEVVVKAYGVSSKYHSGQVRKSGDPYIFHPLVTAYYLAELNMDTATIVAGILHDVVEDTEYNSEELKADFGDEVFSLVDGVTRLGGVKYFGKKGKAEDLRKLLLIMAKDLRVIVVKLADRLHNMQTIDALLPQKRKKIAKETMEIYAPLASRLGMGEMKGILEDLSFKYYLPIEYRKTVDYIDEDEKNREIYIKEVVTYLRSKLKSENIKAHIEGRAKHIYSLWRKLHKYDNDMSKIYDLEAIRVIVDNIGDCYKALGIVHKEWKPLLKRIKDYIAVPKPNGYRSLHTTVFSLGGKIIEVQIKTYEMHEEAEWGIAAHWHYKETKRSGEVPEKLKWINNLLSWQKELGASEFMEGFRTDVFKDRIFVFTPKGEAIDLTDKATPIDFAYTIHTQVGNSCIGAKVNGRIVPLSYELKNGDIIEVITSKKPLGPSRDWIKLAKTPAALHEIRKWLRGKDKDKNLDIGKELLNEELKKIGKTVDKISKKDFSKLKTRTTYSDLDSLLTAIGEGFIKPRKIVSDLFLSDVGSASRSTGILSKFMPIFKKRGNLDPRIVVQGEDNVLLTVASCCSPKPYQSIKGYITRGRGISVHKSDCLNIKNKTDNRILNASWEDPDIFIVSLYIEAEKNVDIFRKLTDILSKLSIKARNINFKRENVLKLTVDIELTKPSQLGKVVGKVSDIQGVLLVKKIK